MKPRVLEAFDKLVLRKRSIIETINDQLKNIFVLEHSRHRSLVNFFVNVLACLVAFVYSLWVDHPRGVAPVPRAEFDFVVLDSVVIGIFVGLSLGAAQLLQLARPYWVPVSCLAVIQGVTFRAVWNRQVQRIAGTGLGLLLFWGLAGWLPLTGWTIAISVTVLTLVVETLVVRHYGIAAVFITPLALLLAEGAQVGGLAPAALIQARFLDTVLGCLFGVLGGACLHSARFRDSAGRLLRRLLPRAIVE